MDPHFRILGPIEVDLEDGRRAAVPRGRALSFLALLLVHRGDAVPLDRVVDELWTGSGPKNAKNAVHVVASRLRAALGDGPVVSEAGAYALRAPQGAVDADRFEERFRRGRETLAGGDPWEATETLALALALWRGEALSEVRYEGFAQPEISRLEDLRLDCLSERIDADLALGREAEVAAELEALVAIHPLHERLRGQQMLALYRGGRQADALAAYRAAHEALVDGLGIEPSPELRALQSAILRQDVPPPLPQAPAGADGGAVARDARRRVTCVFSQLDETVADLDPESLRALLERYHDLARTVCERHGGTVTELRSDSVAAVFGIPTAHEDDPLRAVRAAAELGTRAAELEIGVGARFGICTGDIVAPARRPAAGPAIGEAPATAERLARSATAGETWVAGSTWQLVRHAARASEVGDDAFLLGEVDEVAPAIGRRFDRPLIGREDEIEQLGEAFRGVVESGSPQLVAILGEPGIGKSRLAAELTAIVGDRGAALTGRCPAYGEGLTYWPLREIVLNAAAGKPVDEFLNTLGIGAQVVHRVTTAVGLGEGEAGEEPDWAFLSLIDAFARVRPLVLVVDDVQWAEPTLLDLLLDAVDRLRDAPILVVWVGRSDPFEERPAWARRIERATVLRLGPLSSAASQELLATISDLRLDAAEERRIADAARGNPLFLEQLVAFAGESDPSNPLPPALHALLSARLDLLGTTERSALALGAVAGGAFEVASVHALASGLTRPAVEGACDRLVKRDLLIRERGEAGLLRFRHSLIRDAAYASLAKSARARLHERHASWLADRGAEVPEADARIGFHLETACRYAREVEGGESAELALRASTRLAAAARVARSRGDLLGEIGFLDRAVALVGTEARQGVALLPLLASALSEAASSDRAEEIADRAVARSVALDLPEIGAQAAVERERIRFYRYPETFDVGAAERVVEDAVRTLAGLGDELGLARAAYLMSDLAWLRGDPVGSCANAERMLAHARRAGSGFDVATGLVFMAWSLVEGPWPASEAIERCDALLREASGQRAGELALLRCRAALLAMTGRDEQVRNSRAAARAGLAELHLGAFGVYLTLLDAFAETLAGDPVSAEAALREAEAMVDVTSDRSAVATVYVDLAHAILAQDRHADAAEAVARIDTVPAPCSAEWVIKRHTARALLAEAAGEHQRGLTEARAAVAAAEQTGRVICCANAHRALAKLLSATGRELDAATAARRALALDEAKGNLVGVAETRRHFDSRALDPS